MRILEQFSEPLARRGPEGERNRDESADIAAKVLSRLRLPARRRLALPIR